MRITKRQLRKIIREEKARLLTEQMPPTFSESLQEYLQSNIENITGIWAEEMETMFEENPEAFAGRSTREQWTQQVDAAHDVLVEAIKMAAEQEIDRVEMELHDGQFVG